MCNRKIEDLEEKLHLEAVNDIATFFTNEEIAKIKSSTEIDNYDNPLKDIICYDASQSSSNVSDDRNTMIFKTNKAFEIVKRTNIDWLNSKKNQFFSNDYAEVSSLLGEIRALAEIYTNLYREIPIGKSRLECVPTSTKATPDFRLIDEDYYGEEYTIDFEVFTKTPDKTSQKGIDLGESVTKIKGTEHKITTRISSHRPFSTEKRESETNKHGADLRHIIHLFTQIKSKDKQFIDEHINVLWIDMQDKTISHYGSFLSFAFPTKIREASFLSSALWHAFYGKQGMIILHEMFQGEHNTYRTAKLEHDGRFYLTDNKTDFVVFSFPRKTIVFENPDSDKKIPERFRESLTYLLHFNSVESRIDFPKGSLEKLIRNDVDNLSNLYDYLKERDDWEE